MRIEELQPWNGRATLLLDGGDGPPARPPLHVQAGHERQIRLVGPDGPILDGTVDEGGHGLDLRRVGLGRDAIPPIRTEDLPSAADRTSWWTRRFAAQLLQSRYAPVAAGRRALVASQESLGILELHLRPHVLSDLRDQRDDFETSWDHPTTPLLLRELSDETDGRVKMWRKHARAGDLPPLLVWWCRGLFAYVLLDGHDRIHAALLEDVRPEIVVVANVAHRGSEDIGTRRNDALLLAEMTVAHLPGASANRLLHAAWDPRGEWRFATPGFPLE